MPLQMRGNYNDEYVNARRARGSQRCALYAQRREAQMAEYQQVVEQYVGGHARDRAVKRYAHALGGAQKRAHCHCEYLERIGKAHHAQVLYAYFLNGLLVGIKLHYEVGEAGGQYHERNCHNRHECQSHAIRPVDAVAVPVAPVLREKQHTAAHKAPVAGEHERRKLRA